MANLFLTGGGVPTNAVGEVTDYYRDTATNLIYYRAALGWEVVPSLVPTPDGVGTHWFYGNGTPSNGIGGVNDYYRDDVSGSVYRKNSSNLWEAKGSLDFIGVYGVQWGEGTGAPANTAPLNNLPAGSFYLDVATSDIYYKDNTLTWSNKGQLGGGGGGGGGGGVTVVDNLTTQSTADALSANQGYLLSQDIANKADVVQSYADNALPLASSVAINTEVFNTTYQVKMRSNGTDWEWLGVGKSTWANKPAIAPLGQIICITDIGENGILCRGDGTGWVRMHSVRYYDLAATVTLTNTTLETELATMTVKGGLMGANGKLKIWPLLSMTNNASGKTIKLKMDGNIFYGNTRTNEAQLHFLSIVRNTNSQSVQKISSGITAGLGVTTGVVTSLTVNTSADFTISITGQLAISTDTLTLEGFFVEIV